MQQNQNKMSESLQKLQDLLQKLFRADAADLDFGIYRIINYRRDQLQTFIDDELPAIVDNILNADAVAKAAQQKVEDMAQQIRQTLGDNVMDTSGHLINNAFENVPILQEYLAARRKLVTQHPINERQDDVYNYLYTFFSRYYDNGDFIPRRRYSQTERYAVPYNGEEIYLHWANRDQYYVKSGEHFSSYRFKSQSITVTFDLRDVDIEKDNVKGDKRFFIPLSAETKYKPETDEICIPFEYRPLTDEEKKRYSGQKQQDKIIDAVEPEIMGKLTNHYDAMSALDHQIDDITTLKKHLRTYTRRNTADFFIHKDLKQFLNRELDAYIKNEVLPLSSLIFEDTNFQEDSLTKVNWIETAKLVHTIASKIIDFLSHIEEFQKRLWLKKKFVLSTDYCLTLDRVPEEYYTEITQNAAQLEEWKDLFAIDEADNTLIGADYTEPLSVDFLKENPNLVLDTCHYDSDFKDRLLAHFDNLDNGTDGLLIHGENFQALNLLKEKYRESLKAIYIDPPYNTKGSPILYKNNYKDSSWLTLMTERISTSREFLTSNGTLCAAIDEVEAPNLWQLLQHLFGKENELGIAVVCTNISGVATPKKLGAAHEYAMFFGMTQDIKVGHLEWTEKQLKNYKEVNAKGHRFKWVNLRNDAGGPNKLRENSPRLFYPLFVSGDRVRIPKMEWDEETRQWLILESLNPNEVKVLPIQTNGTEVTWGYSVERVKDMIISSELYPRKDRNGNIRIRLKWYLSEEGILPKTWWDRNLYSAGIYGTTFLSDLLGDNFAFPYPKSIYLVEDCLRVSSLGKKDTVLDYFGGSGTTAHATINLNRQDDGKRKYILIEMGHHFDTALKPRIKKAVYAEKWKDAKPISRESRLSHMFKYHRIESYEDALNNIEFAETERENLFHDEHQLSYLSGSETRESPTFLNVDKLQNPFSYQLNIVKDMQTQKQTVDIPETFNYLLGISVKTRQCLKDGDRRYLVYKGTAGQKAVVIIWRETQGWQDADWERDYRFIQEQELTKDVDEIYVNTNSIVPEAEPLDPLFKRLMFE